MKLHSIDMSSYYFQYVIGDGVTVKPEARFGRNIEIELTQESGNSSEDKVTKSSGSNNECSKSRTASKRKSEVPSTKTKKLRSSQTSNLPDTLPWYEGSWHRCMECGEVTTMGRFFISHVKVGHKMSKVEYMEKYPEDEVETTEYWDCKLCGRGISWNVRSIAAHLSKAHSMTKEEYASKHMESVENGVSEDIDESRMQVEEQRKETVTERPEGDGFESPHDLQVVYDKYL